MCLAADLFHASEARQINKAGGTFTCPRCEETYTRNPGPWWDVLGFFTHCDWQNASGNSDQIAMLVPDRDSGSWNFEVKFNGRLFVEGNYSHENQWVGKTVCVPCAHKLTKWFFIGREIE